MRSAGRRRCSAGTTSVALRALIVLASTGTCLSAAAQPAPSPDGPEPVETPPAAAPQTSAVWYGYQTLLTDAAGVVLFTSGAGLAAGNPDLYAGGASLAAAGGFAYGLGGPIVHIAHDRARVGMLDLLMRGAAPLAGAMVGLASDFVWAKVTDGDIGCANGNYFGCPAGMVIVGGVIAGVIAAMAYDAAFLARETPRASAAKSAHYGTAAIVVAPAIWPADGRGPHGGATLGVVGKF